MFQGMAIYSFRMLKTMVPVVKKHIFKWGYKQHEHLTVRRFFKHAKKLVYSCYYIIVCHRFTLKNELVNFIYVLTLGFNN